MDKITALCLASFLSTSTADLVTTRRVLAAGGTEANPIARAVGVSTIKLATDAGLTAWSVAFSQNHPKLVRTMLLAGSVLYTGAAIHNQRGLK